MCRLCRYLSQPSAKPPIAKVKREAREARESEGKQGEVRESDAAELRRTQPKGDRREEKSEECRGKREESNSK